MSDILDELLDEQKYEKRLFYFRKILYIIIVATIIISLLIIVYGWYNSNIEERNTRAGDILIKTIYNNAGKKILDFDSLSNIVTNNDSPISQIAAIEQINIQIINGNHAEAEKLLEKVINNKNYDNVTTSYARIILLSMMIDKSKLTEEEHQKLKKYLAHFHNENEPFFGTGNLLKTLWYIKLQQKDIAIENLRKILSSKMVPDNVKQQAKALMANLAY